MVSKWFDVAGVTILFFKILDKTGNFAVLVIYCAVPVPVHTRTKPVHFDAKIRPTLLQI